MKQIGLFIKLCWKTSPVYILILVLNSFATAAQTLLNIYFLKRLVDELCGNKIIYDLAVWTICLILTNVGIPWFKNLLGRYLNMKKTYVDNAMRMAMSKKIMNLEYSYLEDPHYLDLKERAVFAITNQNAIEKMIDSVANIATHFITAVGLLVMLASLGWVMIVAFVVALTLSMLSLKYMSKTMVHVMNEIIPINRKFGYYADLMTEKQYQKDIRMYDMSQMIANRSREYLSQTCDIFSKFYAAQGVSNGLVYGVAGGLSAFAYTYLGIRTISEKLGPRISIGSLTMYVSAVVNLRDACEQFIVAIITTMQFANFLKPYLEFMNIEEETKEGKKEKFVGPVETLEFRNVTFKYPKGEKNILENVSFEIHKGEKISIVGLNGAGKSTLVKLICRMYKADAGEIFVNGKNIYDYDYMSYMKEISAVFQDYKIFNFSIEENVSCKQDDTNVSEVNRLIDEVGLREKVDSLKNGIKSIFGKEYDEDGIEMSGGEAQKVAIARALYKEASMVILDEPASALDPIAEAEIYEKFNGLVDEKTALYISHRMSSSVFCDKILIIDGGSVSDFDTHENLMKKTESLYYKLFMAQAKNYALN